MSNNKDIIAITPSRANHIFVKQRTQAAILGLHLLKRKRDALDLKFREVSSQMAEESDKLMVIMRNAIFSLARAKFLGFDFEPLANNHGVDRAEVTVRTQYSNVAGIVLPAFELVIRKSDAFPLTGLARGGQQVINIRKEFQTATEHLVQIASLQYAAKAVNSARRQNNMRVNGLEYVLIPKFNNTLEYIRNELDEYEREEFYRLKTTQLKHGNQNLNPKRINPKLNLKKEPSSRHLLEVTSSVDEFFDCNPCQNKEWCACLQCVCKEARTNAMNK